MILNTQQRKITLNMKYQNAFINLIELAAILSFVENVFFPNRLVHCFLFLLFFVKTRPPSLRAVYKKNYTFALQNVNSIGPNIEGILKIILYKFSLRSVIQDFFPNTSFSSNLEFLQLMLIYYFKNFQNQITIPEIEILCKIDDSNFNINLFDTQMVASRQNTSMKNISNIREKYGFPISIIPMYYKVQLFCYYFIIHTRNNYVTRELISLLIKLPFISKCGTNNQTNIVTGWVVLPDNLSIFNSNFINELNLLLENNYLIKFSVFLLLQTSFTIKITKNFNSNDTFFDKNPFWRKELTKNSSDCAVMSEKINIIEKKPRKNLIRIDRTSLMLFFLYRQLYDHIIKNSKDYRYNKYLEVLRSPFLVKLRELVNQKVIIKLKIIDEIEKQLKWIVKNPQISANSTIGKIKKEIQAYKTNYIATHLVLDILNLVGFKKKENLSKILELREVIIEILESISHFRTLKPFSADLIEESAKFIVSNGLFRWSPFLHLIYHYPQNTELITLDICSVGNLSISDELKLCHSNFFKDMIDIEDKNQAPTIRYDIKIPKNFIPFFYNFLQNEPIKYVKLFKNVSGSPLNPNLALLFNFNKNLWMNTLFDFNSPFDRLNMKLAQKFDNTKQKKISSKVLFESCYNLHTCRNRVLNNPKQRKNIFNSILRLYYIGSEISTLLHRKVIYDYMESCFKPSESGINEKCPSKGLYLHIESFFTNLDKDLGKLKNFYSEDELFSPPISLHQQKRMKRIFIIIFPQEFPLDLNILFEQIDLKGFFIVGLKSIKFFGGSEDSTFLLEYELPQDIVESPTSNWNKYLLSLRNDLGLNFEVYQIKSIYRFINRKLFWPLPTNVISLPKIPQFGEKEENLNIFSVSHDFNEIFSQKSNKSYLPGFISEKLWYLLGSPISIMVSVRVKKKVIPRTVTFIKKFLAGEILYLDPNINFNKEELFLNENYQSLMFIVRLNKDLEKNFNTIHNALTKLPGQTFTSFLVSTDFIPNTEISEFVAKLRNFKWYKLEDGNWLFPPIRIKLSNTKNYHINSLNGIDFYNNIAEFIKNNDFNLDLITWNRCVKIFKDEYRKKWSNHKNEKINLTEIMKKVIINNLQQ